MQKGTRERVKRVVQRRKQQNGMFDWGSVWQLMTEFSDGKLTLGG